MGEEGEQVPHRAQLDDDFLRHPASGAYIRNPFKQKGGPMPINFSAGEFDFNCLEEAMSDWHCVRMDEASFRDVAGLPCITKTAGAMGSTTPATWSLARTMSQQRINLGQVMDLPGGYDFVVTLRKSSYVQTRRPARPTAAGKEALPAGIHRVEKVQVDLRETEGSPKLRVESVAAFGLLAEWNHAHPGFSVKPGDEIVRVNAERFSAAAMLQEMSSAPDALRITVHRPHQQPNEFATLAVPEVAPVREQRTVSKEDAPVNSWVRGSLANPDKAGKRARPVVVSLESK